MKILNDEERWETLIDFTEFIEGGISAEELLERMKML
jgi:hypothetical protein